MTKLFNTKAAKTLETALDRTVGAISMTLGAVGGGAPSLQDGYLAGREMSRYLRTRFMC